MKKLGLIARNKGHPRLKFSPQKQAAQTAGTSGEQLVHSPASVHRPAWQTQRCGIDRLGLLLLDFPAPAWGSEGLCSRPFLPSVPPAVPEWGLLPSSVRRRVGPAHPQASRSSDTMRFHSKSARSSHGQFQCALEFSQCLLSERRCLTLCASLMPGDRAPGMNEIQALPSRGSQSSGGERHRKRCMQPLVITLNN